MQPRESDITRAILDYLALIGAWALKVHGHLGQRPGVPDILACHNGRFIAIEVKQPGNSPTARQEAELAAIGEAGGMTLVAMSVEDVISAVGAAA